MGSKTVKKCKKRHFCKFPAVIRGSQVNNQQKRLPGKYWYDSFGKITILGIFGPNLVLKWGLKSAEKLKKMSFLWKFPGL